MQWTLFYLSGRRQQITGSSFKNALDKSFVAPEALTRVAFYASGDGHNFRFDCDNNLWSQIETLETVVTPKECDKCGVTFEYEDKQIVSVIGSDDFYVTCPGCGKQHNVN